MQLPNEVLALANDQATEKPEQDVASELMKLLPPDPDGPGVEPASNYSMPSASITSSIPPRVPPASVPTSETYPWTSAANARAWLNTVADPKAETGIATLLERHRGDLSLGTAIVALLIALFWGMNHHSRPAPPARVTNAPSAAVPGAAAPTQEGQEAPPAKKQADPQADLSPMERALIALGLAEPPPAPKEYGGNPDIKVWVDLRTALYYCPTSELYGKTPKGKFVSQREAQIDQFEPASRKACE